MTEQSAHGGSSHSQPPQAFVSWAHGDEDWQATVAAFAFALRELGIDADIDLWHQHKAAIDWTTYGPQAVVQNEYVLIPVSAAYKRRWEGTEARGEGAGAAREANTLKALFNDDQHAFRHKVKIVVLPGATIDDIPTELKAVGQRFEIGSIDESGLENLLRTLSNQRAFVPPPVGRLPWLPPKSPRARPLHEARHEITDNVAATVAGLPEREKLVLALTYYEGLTRNEIADMLGISGNRVSQLAQRATDQVGQRVVQDLIPDTPHEIGPRHTAHLALLMDGPHESERVEIEPGQTALTLSERFDFDQGHADVIDHYIYEGRTGNDPDTVMFIFSHQEHRVTTDR